MKATEIDTRETISGAIEVVAIRNVAAESELKEYFIGAAGIAEYKEEVCYKRDFFNNIIITEADGYEYHLEVGMSYDKLYFNGLVARMKKAGHRAREIRNYYLHKNIKTITI